MGINKGTILLGFAIFAIGIFVLPSTMSMFMGQHSWYSVKTQEGKDELCKRCHVAEYGEWETNSANGGAHSTFASDENADCTMCHAVNTSQLGDWGITTTGLNIDLFEPNMTTGDNATNYSSQWRDTSGAHAALTVDCVDCHTNAAAQLWNENEAHTAFYNSTINATHTGEANLTTGPDNPNAACIACHTHTNLNISFVRIASGFNITANHTTGTWDIETFSINQTDMYNTTSTYNASYNSSGLLDNPLP